MKYLLPYQFKKIGFILSPIGFLVWVLMQRGFFTYLLNNILGTSTSNAYQLTNTTIAIISFFGFLFGILCIGFSKEKIEDELVQKTRLESFQFSTLLQICFIILGFVFMAFTNEFDQEGMVYFLVLSILLFWFSFIIRFYYKYHFKFKN